MFSAGPEKVASAYRVKFMFNVLLLNMREPYLLLEGTNVAEVKPSVTVICSRVSGPGR